MDASKLLELMNNKKQDLKSKAKTLKPKAGDNRYVLLPGWRNGEEHIWFHDFGQHFIKGIDGTLKAVYGCSDKTFGQPCALCDSLQSALKTTSDEAIKEALKEGISGQTYLMNVLALDDADPNTPKILQLGKMAFSAVVEMVTQWGVKVFDPAAPMVVTINRNGTGLNTKYTVMPSPTTHTLPAGVLSKLNNIDEYVRQESEDQQRRALLAIDSVAGLLPSADTPRTTTTMLPNAEATRAAVASAPTAAAVALDSELDDLLGDLATGT